MRINLRTVAELDALSTHAVVESHDNQVYQKLSHLHGCERWYKPGSTTPFLSSDIAVTATLFDDGL